MYVCFFLFGFTGSQNSPLCLAMHVKRVAFLFQQWLRAKASSSNFPTLPLLLKMLPSTLTEPQLQTPPNKVLQTWRQASFKKSFSSTSISKWEPLTGLLYEAGAKCSWPGGLIRLIWQKHRAESWHSISERDRRMKPTREPLIGTLFKGAGWGNFLTGWSAKVRSCNYCCACSVH